MSDEELKAEVERLRQENAALKKGTASGLRLKVSEKGAVSVYGMGKFPVTLYKEQWLRLLDIGDEIRAFIATNNAQLKSKQDKSRARCAPNLQAWWMLWTPCAAARGVDTELLWIKSGRGEDKCRVRC